MAPLAAPQQISLGETRWETFLDAISETRLQDEYNQAVRACDVFVSLFATKAGPFTQEEFRVALEQFKTTGTPRIYTYFKETQVSADKKHRADLQSLWAFQEQLEREGHFYTSYEGPEHLKRHFGDQLRRLCEEGGPL